jgi:hypothetical protein
LAHTLLDMLTPESGARFCGEPAVIALNVIGTLLPHSALAPKGRHQRVGVAFPLLDRLRSPSPSLPCSRTVKAQLPRMF